MPTLDEMLTVYSGKKRMRSQKTLQDIGNVLLGETVEDEERFTSKEKIAIWIKLQELRNARKKLAQAQAAGDAKLAQRYQSNGDVDARTAATLAASVLGSQDKSARAKAARWATNVEATAKDLKEAQDFGQMKDTARPDAEAAIESSRLSLSAGVRGEITPEKGQTIVELLNRFVGDESNFFGFFNTLAMSDIWGKDPNAFRAQLESLPKARVPGITKHLERYDQIAKKYALAQANIPKLKARMEAEQAQTFRVGGTSAERYKAMHEFFMGIGPDTTNEQLAQMLSGLGLGGAPEQSDYEMKILEELSGEGLTEQRDKIISSPEFAAWFKDSGYQDPLTAFKARLRERQQDIKAAKKHDKFYDQLKRMGYDDATAREFAKARMGEWQDRKDRFVPRPKDKPKLTPSSLAAGVDAQGALEDKLKKRQVKKAERNQAESLAREAKAIEARDEMKSLQAVNEEIAEKYRVAFGLGQDLGGRGADAVLEGMSEEEIDLSGTDKGRVAPASLFQKMIEARKERKLKEAAAAEAAAATTGTP